MKTANMMIPNTHKPSKKSKIQIYPNLKSNNYFVCLRKVNMLEHGLI